MARKWSHEPVEIPSRRNGVGDRAGGGMGSDLRDLCALAPVIGDGRAVAKLPRPRRIRALRQHAVPCRLAARRAAFADGVRAGLLRALSPSSRSGIGRRAGTHLLAPAFAVARPSPFSAAMMLGSVRSLGLPASLIVLWALDRMQGSGAGGIVAALRLPAAADGRRGGALFPARSAGHAGRSGWR